MAKILNRFNRREFMLAAGALGLGGYASRARPQLRANPAFNGDPFSLGVASGYPTPGGMVLWTRLAPVPEAPGGGMNPEVIPVRWEVARDEGMKSRLASGTVYATPEWAHAVHVEVEGLGPAREYWYRFFAGDAASPVGRTRTAPAFNAVVDRLRFAFASCQHFEQGHFNAYQHMVRDDPELIVFLGDYIYESSRASDHVRKHNAPEPRSLEDYRIRHALYKSDPDLRAAHAACPWVLTWDDHDVQNDYAADQSETLDAPEWFLARRAAAYKAFYEHLPMPRRMLPLGPYARIYTRFSYGNLASFHVLDDRQYRSPQACPIPGRAGSNTVDVADCATLSDPARTMLGANQENWLNAGLAASRTNWNVIAQQTIMAQVDQKPGPGRRAWTDGWDGYPEARRKLLNFLMKRKVANPMVIGGDLHFFNVSDLKQDFDDPASAIVASEIVGTSITSQAWEQEVMNRFLPDNPHIRLTETRKRGYVRMEIKPATASFDLRGMETVTRRDAKCETIASFEIESGRPGAQKS